MSLTLHPLNRHATRLLAEHPEYTEAGLIKVYRDADVLREDLDRLAVRVEELIRERRHIVEVVRAFYREPTTLASAQTIVQLALELDPQLATAEQLRLKDSEESA